MFFEMGGEKPPPSLLVQPLFSRVYLPLMLRRAAGGSDFTSLLVVQPSRRFG